jgi:hypothetical protein
MLNLSEVNKHRMRMYINSIFRIELRFMICIIKLSRQIMNTLYLYDGSYLLATFSSLGSQSRQEVIFDLFFIFSPL